jgi:hypothetical protein
LENLGVDGRIILNFMFRKWDVDTDRIALAQVKDRSQELVHTVMKLQLP